MAGFSSIIEGCRNIYCDSPLPENGRQYRCQAHPTGTKPGQGRCAQSRALLSPDIGRKFPNHYRGRRRAALPAGYVVPSGGRRGTRKLFAPWIQNTVRELSSAFPIGKRHYQEGLFSHHRRSDPRYPNRFALLWKRADSGSSGNPRQSI